MKVTVKTFAVLKEHFGPIIELNVEVGTTANDLKNILIERKSDTAGLLQISRCAVSDIFVSDTTVILENDTVFIIPPSSGG